MQMLKPIRQTRSGSFGRDAQAPVGARESVANLNFGSCVQEVETAPAQQRRIIFKSNSPIPEAVRLPTVSVLSQHSKNLLSGGRYTGDEPHDFRI
jgi:hypothetical protein